MTLRLRRARPWLAETVKDHGAGLPGSVPTDLYGGGMIDVPVDVIRSQRRRRTVQASLVKGRLEVRVPAGLAPDEEKRLVRKITDRVIRKATSADIDLNERARQLAARYGLPEPADVVWSSRQMKRWGSCTPDEGRIRISDRLAEMPGWVLDSVLVHELAHLEVADHGPDFEALVDRYELSERAKGYLMARSGSR